MKCELACRKHLKLKSFGREFVEFWHDYFQSTGNRVRNLPIKCFLSSVDLVRLLELSACNCKNLVKNLFPAPTCTLCQNSFSTLAELELHVAEMKKKKREEKLQQQLLPPQYECQFCSKRLLTKLSLIRHMELHTKEYVCETCDKAFTLTDIERHKVSRLHLKRVTAQLHHADGISRCHRRHSTKY